MRKQTLKQQVEQQVIREAANRAVALNYTEQSQLVDYCCQLYCSSRSPRRVKQELISFLESQTNPIQL